jgi:hypothetical protein
MRFLLLLILALLLLWYLLPEPEPVPVEESFMGDQVRALQRAESVEDQYLDADRQARELIDRQTSAPDPDDDGQR